MKKISWFVILFISFALLGYFREFFFVHLNIIMYEKYYNTTSPAPFPGIMNFFRKFSYEYLYYSKYIYTLLWLLAFLLVNYLAVKKLTGNSYLIKILIYTYLSMFTLALFSMLYGYLINGSLQDDEYTLSRWLMGIAQSPIICLILVASEKLYTKSFQS
jgi:hypothetical protein